MFHCKIQIGNMPLALTLISDGTISISRLSNFKGICDEQMIFTDESFFTTHSKICYNYDSAIEYKEEPELLKWLQDQRLEQPV